MRKDTIHMTYKLIKNMIYPPLTHKEKYDLEYRYGLDVSQIYSYKKGKWFLDKEKQKKWMEDKNVFRYRQGSL